jgi:hypothetical protein
MICVVHNSLTPFGKTRTGRYESTTIETTATKSIIRKVTIISHD